MKRNFLLIVGLFVAILLVVNSTKRLLTFRTTNQKVEDAQARLEQLKRENEALKGDLAYKSTNEYKEQEIRDKLGLAREGEVVVVLPQEETESLGDVSGKKKKENWEKWRDVFFGS